MARRALVLSGGGAKGSFQIGWKESSSILAAFLALRPFFKGRSKPLLSIQRMVLYLSIPGGWIDEIFFRVFKREIVLIFHL